MDAPRYAIYFVPPASSDLYRFGAVFLGFDCYSGEELGCPDDAGLDPREWSELTREPREVWISRHAESALPSAAVIH